MLKGIKISMGNSNNRYKFRAWQTRHKEMYQPFVGYIEFPDIVVGFDDGDLRLEGEKNVILMQFTGLKDRNGREIYEGDVVNILGHVSKVEFRHGAFIVGYHRGSSTRKRPKLIQCNSNNVASRVEVLGNVFENPELLTKAKI